MSTQSLRFGRARMDLNLGVTSAHCGPRGWSKYRKTVADNPLAGGLDVFWHLRPDAVCIDEIGESGCCEPHLGAGYR